MSERRKLTELPSAAKAVLNRYKNLRIGDKTIRCPYYRNPRSGRERWGLNAYSGKGSPDEIEQELRIIEKLEGKEFDKLPEEIIRDIMQKRHLGVECSGFLAHILDAWTNETRGKRIYQLLEFPAKSLFGKIAVRLRPFTHIDVATLTTPQNATEFFDWKEMRVGDLIRFRTPLDPNILLAEGQIDHAVLITGVDRNEEKIPRAIHYAQSVREKRGEGIKEGTISITDPTALLEFQIWKETPETGLTINLLSAPPKFYHLNFLD